MKPYNQNIAEVLRISREMMCLADEGDAARQDKSCGILYGILRDAAYKIRDLAEHEKLRHKQNGLWDNNEI